MNSSGKDIDITRNIKIIEWLKSELLTDIAYLFKALVCGIKDEVHESIADTLSNIILVCYILARRLGLTYNSIEIRIQNKIKLGKIQEHDIEKYYGDLTELSKHFDIRRVKP